MRWTNPRDGEIRIKSWFAWTPVRMHGESRWLERVTVSQLYHRGKYASFWHNHFFVDPSPEEETP